MDENKVKSGTVILEASTVQEATTLVQEYEAKGYDLVGTPGDFNYKILITMRKQDQDKLNNMMNSIMSNINTKGK